MKAIRAKYIAPSNVRGARIKAEDCNGNSATLSYDYALNADERHAMLYCINKVLEKVKS